MKYKIPNTFKKCDSQLNLTSKRRDWFSEGDAICFVLNGEGDQQDKPLHTILLVHIWTDIFILNCNLFHHQFLANVCEQASVSVTVFASIRMACISRIIIFPSDNWYYYWFFWLWTLSWSNSNIHIRPKTYSTKTQYISLHSPAYTNQCLVCNTIQ